MERNYGKTNGKKTKGTKVITFLKNDDSTKFIGFNYEKLVDYIRANYSLDNTCPIDIINCAIVNLYKNEFGINNIETKIKHGFMSNEFDNGDLVTVKIDGNTVRIHIHSNYSTLLYFINYPLNALLEDIFKDNKKVRKEYGIDYLGFTMKNLVDYIVSKYFKIDHDIINRSIALLYVEKNDCKIADTVCDDTKFGNSIALTYITNGFIKTHVCEEDITINICIYDEENITVKIDRRQLVDQFYEKRVILYSDIDDFIKANTNEVPTKQNLIDLVKINKIMKMKQYIDHNYLYEVQRVIQQNIYREKDWVVKHHDVVSVAKLDEMQTIIVSDKNIDVVLAAIKTTIVEKCIDHDTVSIIVYDKTNNTYDEQTIRVDKVDLNMLMRRFILSNLINRDIILLSDILDINNCISVKFIYKSKEYAFKLSYTDNYATIEAKLWENNKSGSTIQFDGSMSLSETPLLFEGMFNDVVIKPNAKSVVDKSLKDIADELLDFVNSNPDKKAESDSYKILKDILDDESRINKMFHTHQDENAERINDYGCSKLLIIDTSPVFGLRDSHDIKTIPTARNIFYNNKRVNSAYTNNDEKISGGETSGSDLI